MPERRRRVRETVRHNTNTGPDKRKAVIQIEIEIARNKSEYGGKKTTEAVSDTNSRNGKIDIKK